MISILELHWTRIFNHNGKKYTPNGYYNTPLLVDKNVTVPYVYNQSVCTKPTGYRQVLLTEVHNELIEGENDK